MKITEKHKEQIRKKIKERIKTGTFKTIFVKGHGINRGRVHTEIAKKNMSKAAKGENNGFFDKKHSIESRKKMSEGKGANNETPKTREQERNAGRKKPERCEICKRTGSICFDHDHATGKFRGWICHRCNLALGLVKDSPELLNTLSKYLHKDEFKDESLNETRGRFNRWLHYLIHDVAKEDSVDPKEIKDEVRTYLIEERYIQISCSELSIKGFAAGIYFLNNRYTS